jgi:hypothetical protein
VIKSIPRLAPTEGLTIDDYFDLIQQKLREGQLRIVFFLEDSSPELRSVVDFLNRQMERSEVLLVEARQYSHGGSKIVAPTLFVGALALFNLIGPARKEALIALGIAVLVPVVSIATIQLILR